MIDGKDIVTRVVIDILGDDGAVLYVGVGTRALGIVLSVIGHMIHVTMIPIMRKLALDVVTPRTIWAKCGITCMMMIGCFLIDSE